MNKTIINKVSVVLILVILFVIAGSLDYYRGKNKRITQKHRDDHHPVIIALFAQKIKKDQPVAELISSWPPTRISKHNNFTTLYYVKDNKIPEACCGFYSTYINIIAIDEKLAKASAIEGVLSEIEYVFFSRMDTEQEDAYWTSRLQSVAARE